MSSMQVCCLEHSFYSKHSFYRILAYTAHTAQCTLNTAYWLLKIACEIAGNIRNNLEVSMLLFS